MMRHFISPPPPVPSPFHSASRRNNLFTARKIASQPRGNILQLISPHSWLIVAVRMWTEIRDLSAKTLRRNADANNNLSFVFFSSFRLNKHEQYQCSPKKHKHLLSQSSWLWGNERESHSMRRKIHCIQRKQMNRIGESARQFDLLMATNDCLVASAQMEWICQSSMWCGESKRTRSSDLPSFASTNWICNSILIATRQVINIPTENRQSRKCFVINLHTSMINDN